MVVEALEATDMVFINVLIERGCERNIGLDSCDPLIDTTFNLLVIFVSTI
jgi:hypothetical protein